MESETSASSSTTTGGTTCGAGAGVRGTSGTAVLSWTREIGLEVPRSFRSLSSMFCTSESRQINHHDTTHTCPVLILSSKSGSLRTHRIGVCLYNCQSIGRCVRRRVRIIDEVTNVLGSELLQSPSPPPPPLLLRLLLGKRHVCYVSIGVDKPAFLLAPVPQ